MLSALKKTVSSFVYLNVFLNLCILFDLLLFYAYFKMYFYSFST